MSEPRDRRFLIRKPRALQYFHNGQLMKDDEKERVSGRFELFFDLLYVALIANFADYLAEEPSGERLVQFLITFVPAWHAWADAKENANNYYNDDIIQRIGILWVMALLVLYGNNANAVGESIDAQRATLGAYMAIRFSQISFFFVNSLASHHHRTQNRAYFAMVLVGLLIWIPVYFESVSNRSKIAVAFVAIVYEEFSYVLTFGPWLARHLKLEYTTAVDIEHENDRYTAFTIIVLGEFTYAILVGSPASGGLNTKLLRAVWTLVIAFCFNSLYVNNDGAIDSMHPVRRSVWSSFAWLLLHLPMSAGLLIGGHVSAAATIEEFNSGRRWLWGGGLGVGMLGMYVIALLYKDCDPPHKLVMPKHLRVSARLAAAIVYALLPLASEEALSATALVSCGAGISSFVVIWETLGGMEKGACVFESWKDDEDADINSRTDGKGQTE